MKTMTLDYLGQSLKDKVVAVRRSSRLQPAGGASDKVFPASYERGQYAVEERIFGEQHKVCVVLDSVQSQANRMELALLEAHRAKVITLPIVEVTFPADLPEVGTITSLEAPHRLADAIFRDSLNKGVKFRDSAEGSVLNSATAGNGTGLFGICPSALLFGLWDSTGPRGGAGLSFPRAIASEVIGVDIVQGTRPTSRIDPLRILVNAGPVYDAKGGGWTLFSEEAVWEKGGPKLLGKDGKPSEINHGSIMPSIRGNHGGVTVAYAIHTTVLSLAALRRLRFPLNSTANSDVGVDNAARVVLAALGLCGATLSLEQGCDLRSRCLLVPDKGFPAAWEIVKSNGNVEEFELTADDACTLLKEAVAAATRLGLPWHSEPVTLTPSEGLCELVRKSRNLTTKCITGG